jgi:hypothetical protein
LSGGNGVDLLPDLLPALILALIFGLEFNPNSLILLVPQEGFEPPAPSLRMRGLMFYCVLQPSLIARNYMSFKALKFPLDFWL